MCSFQDDEEEPGKAHSPPALSALVPFVLCHRSPSYVLLPLLSTLFFHCHPSPARTYHSGLSPHHPFPRKSPWPSFLGSTNSKTTLFVSGDDTALSFSVFLSRPFHWTVNSLKAGNSFLLYYCGYNMQPCASTQKVLSKYSRNCEITKVDSKQKTGPMDLPFFLGCCDA